jgi:hypothetical protein
VGVAEKVTLVPAQMVVVPVLMLTEGVTNGFTEMVMWLDVADVGDAQLALLVNITQTESLLASPAVV